MDSRKCAAGTLIKEEGGPERELITTIEEARRFMINCYKAVGTPEEHAEIVADNLIAADYRGHYSHGMNRLEAYIRMIKNGTTDPLAKCSIIKENAATALVDGNNGLGAVVGKFCMNLAIEKAKDSGIAFVVARRSNHYGIAGIYTLQAIERGFIGITFSNTPPLMVPTRAKESALGTNPIALGAPALDGDSFVLDMASTAVAIGKIELARRKNIPIPEGWAMNNNGKVETNAQTASQAKRLMPLGGPEESSGYKGYGLGVLVEILSGLLSGSAYGPNIHPWISSQSGAPSNLGQGFMVINPSCFEDGFGDRLSDLMGYLRNMEPVTDPEKPVLIHGDPERMHMEKVKKDGGLLYVKNQHESNARLAKELNVPPMVSK